jgi:diguanylate cyclase (GGDEF)-like protein
MTMQDPLLTQTSDIAPFLNAAGDACLVLIYPTGPMMGTRYVLNNEIMAIGRTADCQIQNTDSSVSRRHAQIERRAGGYFVTDLGSRNGTYVNNSLMTESPLADGDYLRIGNCIYRFLAGGNIEAEYHEEIYRMTVSDALTGVANRRPLMEFVERELARSARTGRPLSVAMIDIDHFKRINDDFGHLTGDYVLRQLCGLARDLVRRDELFARFGGEEFTWVLPESDRSQAYQACDRLRLAVANHPFTVYGENIRVTVSVGIVTVNGAGNLSAADLLEQADRKLYQAKNAGRNRVAA